MAFQAYSRDKDCGMCQVPGSGFQVPSAAALSLSPLSQSPLNANPKSEIRNPQSTQLPHQHHHPSLFPYRT